MLLENSSPRRQRATSQKYVDGFSARKVVLDSQRVLGAWQIKVAELRGLVGLGKGDMDQIKSEAEQLLPLVISSRIDLERAIAPADEKVATHSLVRAVRNAFLRLEGDLLHLSAPLTGLDGTFRVAEGRNHQK